MHTHEAMTDGGWAGWARKEEKGSQGAARGGSRGGTASRLGAAPRPAGKRGRGWVLLALASTLAGCVGTTTDEEAGPDVGADALGLTVAEGEPCHLAGGVARPTAVTHLQDESLSQSVGPMTVWSRGLTRSARGSLLATVVGTDDAATLRVNHHFVFDAGTLRTQNDRVALMPTDDECVFAIEADLFVVDGTGAFEGLAGEGRARGTLNVCGARGRIVWAARLCE